MKKSMRFRTIFIGMGSLLSLILLMVTDPDSNLVQNLPFGATTLSTLIILFQCVFYIGFLHFSRRALMDYINLEEYFNKAKMTAQGAGLALIAVGIMMISISLIVIAAVR